MKDLLITLSLLPLLWACTARAEQPAYPFRVIPKADCIATIQVAFAPESLIQEGLAALSQLQLEKSSTLACLGEALGNWEQEYPARLVRAPDLLPKFGQRIADLQIQAQCFNPWPAGTKTYNDFEKIPPAGCKGKVLNVEEKPKVQAEYQKWTGISRLFSRLPEAFLKSYASLGDGLRAERDRLVYCRPSAPGISGPVLQQYQAQLEARCNSQAMTEAETVAQQAKVADLEKEFQSKSKTINEQAQKLNELFGYSYVPDAIFEKIDGLLPLVKKLVCTKQKDGNAWWENELKAPCDDSFSDGSNLPKDREALLAFLGDVDALRTKARQEREARTLQHELEEAKLNAPRLQSYEGQRILLQFQAYLKRGGNPNALESFCSGYEAQLERDKKLAEATFWLKEKTKAIKIESETNKKYAGEYGLTEGEIGALNSYLGSFYQVVNKPLYQQKEITPEIALYRDTLNSGLRKLPDFKGTVTRFADLPPEVLAQHKVGSVITYEAFTSTSKAKSWKWDGNTKFLIYSKHKGKDVSETNSNEQEVLFEAGTKFKVLERSKKGFLTKIVLSEVEEPAETSKKTGGKKK